MKITDNEGCKFCIDRGWTFFCTDPNKVPGIIPSLEAKTFGFCCAGQVLFESPSLCGKEKMTCSTEVNRKMIPSFVYGLCPPQTEICGRDRDILVRESINKMETGYMYPNHTCLWRFIAQSINPMDAQDSKSYRAIKLRLFAKGDVRVKCILVENPKKIQDSMSMFENADLLGREWDFFEKSTGATLLFNVTSQLYLLALPQEYGAVLSFEYFVTTIKDPSLLLNSTIASNPEEASPSPSAAASTS